MVFQIFSSRDSKGVFLFSFLQNAKKGIPKVQRNVNLIDLVKSVTHQVAELSNKYLVAKFGFDSAENESSKKKFAKRYSP